VRIPLGTALLEEVAFRGVLQGAWAREASTASSVAGSSLAFGLWHIGPALELLRINAIAQAPLARAAAVVAAVAATAAGGALFSLVRLRTGGIAGPAFAHAAINAFATLAAFVRQRTV
jgi:membrane protease YdiL (CAAX protease family)